MYPTFCPYSLPSQTNRDCLQSLKTYCYLDFGSLIFDNFSLTASLTNSDRDLYPKLQLSIIESIFFTKSDGSLTPGYLSFVISHQYHMFIFKLNCCNHVTHITQSLNNSCYIHVT